MHLLNQTLRQMAMSHQNQIHFPQKTVRGLMGAQGLAGAQTLREPHLLNHNLQIY